MREITIKYGEQIRFIVKDSSNKDTLLSASGYLVEAIIDSEMPTAVRFEFRQIKDIIEGQVIYAEGIVVIK